MSNGKVLTLDNLKLDSCSQEEDLATLLTDEILDRVPMLHEQEDTPYPDRIVHAIYFIPLNKHGVWYLTEYGPETSLCYGLVENGDCGWGNFSIEELAESGAQRYIIEGLPCTFRQLKNSELKHQLTQKQFKDAFGDLMLWEGDETSNLKAQNPETKVPAHVDCQWR